MKFFKKNSYEIMRLFVIQIGMTIFASIITTTAMQAFKKQGSEIAACIAGIFSTVFYLFVVYVIVWEIGSKRSEKIECGREIEDKCFGFKISLYASVPNLILSALMLLGLFRLAFPNDLFIGMYGLAKLINGILNFMYLGIINYFFDFFSITSKSDLWYILNALFSLLTIFPVLIVSQIACRFGERNIRLTKATPPSRD